MATLTLQPQGAATPLTVDVAWDAARNEMTGFTLTAAEGTLQATGQVGADGTGTLQIGARLLPFYFSRADGELHLWLDGETYVFALPRAQQAGRQRAGALPAS